MTSHRILPILLSAAVLIPASWCYAGSAWQALDTVRAQRGQASVASVTQMRGHRGQNQPAVWEVVTRVADSERVYVTEGTSITADTVYSAGGGVPIDMRRLRVDSTEVFKVANRAAADAKVGFDALDYELRAAQLGNAPLWVVHMRDGTGRDVGRLEISGESRAVIKQTWFSTPKIASREPIGPEPRRRVVRSYSGQPSGETRSSEGRWAGNGTGVDNTANRLKDGFESLGTGFGKIFGGNTTTQPVRDQSPTRKVPTTSRTRR